MQNVAASLLIYDLTGSAFMVGACNFSLFLASLVLAPVAGSAADRIDRRRVLLAVSILGAAITWVLAGITAAGVVTAWSLLLSMMVLGVAIAFMAPAMFALVPSLVGEDRLDQAMGLVSASMNIGRTLGPLLAAWLIETAGYSTSFAVNASSFGVFAGVLVLIRPRQRTTVEPEGDRPRLREAFATVRQSPSGPALFGAVAVSSVASDPIYTLAPVLSVDVLDAGQRGAGLLVGAYGLGAALTAAVVLPRLTRARVVARGLTGVGVGIVLVAVAPSLEVALVGAALAGAGSLLALTRATTLIQAGMPEGQLGRVMALWSVCFVGTRPPAALVDGLLAEVASARVATASFGVLALATAAWMRFVVRPRLR